MLATQNDDGPVQSAAPATKTATNLRKMSQKYCACRAKTTFDTLQNTSECHEAPRLPRDNEATRRLKPPRTYHRHGHMVLTRTVADGCERLRTVANVNATSSQHTFNHQTPRVKRKLLLRILENIDHDY